MFNLEIVQMATICMIGLLNVFRIQMSSQKNPRAPSSCTWTGNGAQSLDVYVCVYAFAFDNSYRPVRVNKLRGGNNIFRLKIDKP